MVVKLNQMLSVELFWMNRYLREVLDDMADWAVPPLEMVPERSVTVPAPGRIETALWSLAITTGELPVITS